jgi:hypothetical protein
MKRTIGVIAIVGTVFPFLVRAEDLKPGEELSARDKWAYHARSTFGPSALMGGAILAGAVQAIGRPSGWPSNAEGYGRRLASTIATNAIRHSAELGLDLAFREDPRYRRSEKSSFGGQVRHAVGSEFTTKDIGHGRRFAYARIGSALVAGYASTIWQPDPRAANGLRLPRQNRVRLGLEQTGIILGLDAVANIAAEIWPGFRKTMFRR